jgi:hypothetical protein
MKHSLPGPHLIVSSPFSLVEIILNEDISIFATLMDKRYMFESSGSCSTEREMVRPGGMDCTTEFCAANCRLYFPAYDDILWDKALETWKSAMTAQSSKETRAWRCIMVVCCDGDVKFCATAK